MDQKPVHSAHGLTLTHIHFYHVIFSPPPPPTSGLRGIKAHFMWVSGGWNREWCHHTPPTSSLELLIKSFRELLCTTSADSRHTLCIILKCQHRYMFMRFLLELYELCIFYFYFFLSNGSRINESWPRKGTYSTYINGNVLP